jgi:hypothetical protein
MDDDETWRHQDKMNDRRVSISSPYAMLHGLAPRHDV